MENITEEYIERIKKEKEKEKEKASEPVEKRDTDNKKYLVKKKRSVIPIYFVAGFVVIWAIFLPLYKFSNFLLLALFSGAIYLIESLIFKPKEVTPEIEAEKEVKVESVVKDVTTGDPVIDKMVKDADEAIAALDTISEGIKSGKVRLQIAHLQDVTEKIVNVVKETPAKKQEVRRFFNYYLPTTIKLLKSYDEMDDIVTIGENVQTSMEKIEEMLDKLTVAFDKQLDSLYGTDALDISTDIEVMDNLLKQEGLVK